MRKLYPLANYVAGICGGIFLVRQDWVWLTFSTLFALTIWLFFTPLFKSSEGEPRGSR